jgi:hypothetical protein
MKNKKLMSMLWMTALFSALILGGCPTDPNNDQPPVNPDSFEGKLLILQAYGSSSGAEGVSHSFVELYNKTDEAISLDGVGLYYADGTTVGNGQINTAIEDGQWKMISLDGKTIPAGSSFLILGSKQSTVARYQIPDDSGDINSTAFTLSNRAFKVALLQSTVELTVQNPFDIDDDGTKAADYIDMVGAANNYQERDLIFGFETLPARNSASESVRRLNLIDTDNNRGASATFPAATGDFTSIRYASGGISDEELAVRKPRNSGAGTWDPFEAPGEPIGPTDPTVAGTPSALANKLLIFQAGAATNGAIARNFVELYNTTDSPITLTGTYSLQYTGATGTNWTVINLDGTIPAKGSFLVVGKVAESHDDNRLFIADNEADQIAGDSFTLSNNGFKVALMANQKKLTVANPFAMTGGKAEDYVDMLGAFNSGTQPDGYETAHAAVISKQAAARRSSLTDTDNNSADFERIDYRTADLDKYRPRTSSDGEWDPFEEPPVVGEESEKLMILQANTYGNADGGYESSLVELYNNTASEIDLAAGNYYLHIGGSGNSGWTHAIALTEKIPSKCSYLIRTTNTGDVATNTPFLLPVADQTDNFVIANNNFKVAVITGANQTLLTDDNPFTGNGGQPITGYVDMLGVGNATGFETAANSTSRPQPPRRISLTDTDNNSTDFARYDSRADSNPNTAVPANELYKYWPRNSSAGAWNPITGESPVHPVRRN